MPGNQTSKHQGPARDLAQGLKCLPGNYETMSSIADTKRQESTAQSGHAEEARGLEGLTSPYCFS